MNLAVTSSTYRDGCVEALFFRAVSRLAAADGGFSLQARSQARRRISLSVRNRRINTIFRLLYGTVHQFSSLNLCTEPVHAVAARECTRGRAHARLEARCTHVRRTSRFHAHAWRTYTRGNRPPIRLRSMNGERHAATKQTHPCNWQIDRLIQSHRRCFFFVGSLSLSPSFMLNIPLTRRRP